VSYAPSLSYSEHVQEAGGMDVGLIYTRVVKADYDSWIKLTIWSGRPLRALANPYLRDWEQNRQAEIRELQAKGVVPLVYEIDRLHREGRLTEEIEDAADMSYVEFCLGVNV
jgi:hypothetical protein